MGDKTGISWTEATWNCVTGCEKVSSGCKFCYSERDWPRFQHLAAYKGRAFTDVKCHIERLDKPLRWQRPRRIFVNSVSDLFHKDVSFEFIAAVFGVMAAAKQHTFQILTKRPERMLEWFHWFDDRTAEVSNKFPYEDSFWCRDQVLTTAAASFGVELPKIQPQYPLPNVWLGVSTENQEAADKRIPILMKCPAALRFLSCEPLIGPVKLAHLDVRKGAPHWSIDWVICGGESGANARPMELEWARSLRDECQTAGIKFHMKQLSQASGQGFKDFTQLPPDLQIREDPTG